MSKKISYVDLLVRKLRSERFYIKELAFQKRKAALCHLQSQALHSAKGFSPHSYKEDYFEEYSNRFIACLNGELIATFRLIKSESNPQKTLPIQAHLHLPDECGQPIMEVSQVLFLPRHQRRSYYMSVIACCYAYAEKHQVQTAYIATPISNSKIFETLGLRAFAKAFYDPDLLCQITPRSIGFHEAKELIAKLAYNLQSANIIQI